MHCGNCLSTEPLTSSACEFSGLHACLIFLANMACPKDAQKDAQRMPKTNNCKKAEVCIDKEVTVRV